MVFLLELVAYAAILYGFVTQVFIPIWRGTKLFPILRREGELLDKLEGERQTTHEKWIEKEIKQEQKKRGG